MPFAPLEIVIVVLVLALLFGASRIPELARTAGRGVREVKEPLREARTLLSLEDPARETRDGEPTGDGPEGDGRT
ncbi:MAG: twin-arginine translocase TatA/TatE family subunit [Thermoleophilia bacterium]|nr:twin-arginine translocase TatA/TatE family subunit [Thermoleophilia bacterium]